MSDDHYRQLWEAGAWGAYENRYRMQQQAVERAYRARDEALALLREVEWVQVDDLCQSVGENPDLWRWCSSCDTWRRTDEPDAHLTPHAPDCRLAKLLEGEK